MLYLVALSLLFGLYLLTTMIILCTLEPYSTSYFPNLGLLDINRGLPYIKSPSSMVSSFGFFLPETKRNNPTKTKSGNRFLMKQNPCQTVPKLSIVNDYKQLRYKVLNYSNKVKIHRNIHVYYHIIFSFQF